MSDRISLISHLPSFTFWLPGVAYHTLEILHTGEKHTLEKHTEEIGEMEIHLLRSTAVAPKRVAAAH